jgi:hypothetical protein
MSGTVCTPSLGIGRTRLGSGTRPAAFHLFGNFAELCRHSSKATLA